MSIHRGLAMLRRNLQLERFAGKQAKEVPVGR